MEATVYGYYLTWFFIKIESNIEKFSTKTINPKFSINPKSCKGFGRGRRNDWRSPMDTPKYDSYIIKMFYYHQVHGEFVYCSKHM